MLLMVVDNIQPEKMPAANNKTNSENYEFDLRFRPCTQTKGACGNYDKQQMYSENDF